MLGLFSSMQHSIEQSSHVPAALLGIVAAWLCAPVPVICGKPAADIMIEVTQDDDDLTFTVSGDGAPTLDASGFFNLYVVFNAGEAGPQYQVDEAEGIVTDDGLQFYVNDVPSFFTDAAVYAYDAEDESRVPTSVNEGAVAMYTDLDLPVRPLPLFESLSTFNRRGLRSLLPNVRHARLQVNGPGLPWRQGKPWPATCGRPQVVPSHRICNCVSHQLSAAPQHLLLCGHCGPQPLVLSAQMPCRAVGDHLQRRDSIRNKRL